MSATGPLSLALESIIYEEFIGEAASVVLPDSVVEVKACWSCQPRWAVVPEPLGAKPPCPAAEALNFSLGVNVFKTNPPKVLAQKTDLAASHDLEPGIIIESETGVRY